MKRIKDYLCSLAVKYEVLKHVPVQELTYRVCKFCGKELRFYIGTDRVDPLETQYMYFGCSSCNKCTTRIEVPRLSMSMFINNFALQKEEQRIKNRLETELKMEWDKLQ